MIADLASHVFDLLDWLIGPFAAVSAATRIAYPERPAANDPGRRVKTDAEDCVMLLARMASGAVGTIEATKIATGSEDELRLEIHGSRGALRYNGMDPHHLDWYDAAVARTAAGGASRLDPHRRRPPLSPARHGLSQREVGHRLDRRPRRLSGEFFGSGCRWPARRRRASIRGFACSD